MGLYKRNSTAGLSYMGSNKYSGGYGPKGMYVNRNRGLSLDRLQGNGYSNGNSLQTSPTRRPSYGLTRTRSQAHLLAHSSGEDSYGSSSRPPSTYDTYSRHEINLNRSNSQLHGSRNGNLDKNLDFLDSGTPPSPPGSRKTSYTREYVRNLPTTVSGHSAPATRGRLTRRSTTLRDSSSINNSYQDHSSYSSQSSDKSADGIYIEKNGPEVSIQRGFTEIPIKRTNSSSSLLPKSVTSTPVAVKKKVSREPSYDRNSQSGKNSSSNEQYSYESRPRINSQTFRKSRSPGKRSSRSPSRSPGRSTFGSDENDRVNNNNDAVGNNGNFMQKSAAREREEEKRRLQAEMRRREQELLSKIKDQQRELESMKQEKGKVERELHRQELMRERERKIAEELKGASSGGSQSGRNGLGGGTNHGSSGSLAGLGGGGGGGGGLPQPESRHKSDHERNSFKTGLQRPPPLTKRQIAVSRSSSSATSSSASKPDPDDIEEEEDYEHEPQQQTIVINPVHSSRLQKVAPRTLGAPTPMQKSYLNNENKKPNNTTLPQRSKLTSQSPALGRRNPNRLADDSPAPSRRAKSEGLSRIRSKDPSPAAIKREPLTLSSLRAAAGNNTSTGMSASTPTTARKTPVAANSTPATARKVPNASSTASKPSKPANAKFNKPSNKPPARQAKPKAGPREPARSRLIPKARDDLVGCTICGRNFAEDRIEKHQEICMKSQSKKRKTFDMAKKRLQGTDAETFALKPKRGGARAQKAQKEPPPKKKNDWRKKREDFVAALRAAKAAQRHIAAGGKVSDLPPPPPSDNSDYIQCPHCSRRFNESVAERHIPKCKDIKSNKRR